MRHGDGGARRDSGPTGRNLTALPELDAASASVLDARDPLASFAAEFHHPRGAAGRKAVYLCGHSLGLQPKAAASYLSVELAEWAALGRWGTSSRDATLDRLSRSRRVAARGRSSAIKRRAYWPDSEGGSCCSEPYTDIGAVTVAALPPCLAERLRLSGLRPLFLIFSARLRLAG